jgi:ATP-binding cassette subfamily F protein uup
LCTVLIQNPNFLILDEPTNDLDILTLNVLESFLLDFPGNLLVVSHDRYFMDKIVDHLFVFDTHGNINGFPGNYTDYRAYEDSQPVKQIVKEKNIDTREKSSPKGKLSYNENKEFQNLEKEIANLTKEKSAIEKEFENGEIESSKINEISQKLQETISSIETKEERWLELSMKLEG